MFAQQVFAGLFTGTLIVYFVEIASLIRQMRQGYPEFWQEIGSPDIFSPNGQSAFLAFVFGSRGYPQDLDARLLRKCVRLRVYLLSGMAFFIALMLVISTSTD